MRPRLAFIAVVACAGSGWAQDTVPGWDGLETTNLETVHVLDDTGTETTGRLIRLDPDAIVLLVDGTERSFDARRVERLEKRGDSLKNGAIIGAVVGGVLSTIGAAMADCPDSGNSCPGTKIALGIIGTGIYTGVGVGIDALVTGRTTLYEAPEGSASASGGGGSLAHNGGRAFGIRIAW